MQYRNNKARVCAGVTLVEMIIAVALIVIVFAAITPLFRGILNSWDSKAGAAETIQNGRVLIDHLNHNLSKAVQISDVSGSAVTTGYIEFEDNDGNTLRYDINSTSNYVEFGVVGGLSDLAGPVSTLQFTCYDVCDLDTPITEVNDIRTVEVQTTLTNSATLGADRTFTTTVYLRVNDSNGTGGGGGDPNITKGTPFEFEGILAATPALSQINNSHYLLSYAGGAAKDHGWAAVLTVNAGTITKEDTPLLVDADKLKTPALIQVNSAHHLLAYSGDGDVGTAVILEVNTDTWQITKKIPSIYDAVKGKTPTLAQIDGTHYLCTYGGNGDDGYAVVLKVNEDWTIEVVGTALEFDEVKGKTSALAQIDPTHFLLAYEGNNLARALVLMVNTGTGVITVVTPTPLRFDLVKGKTPKLSQINSTHYLCVYDDNNLGYAVVLIVNTVTWEVTKGTSYPYETTEGKTPALAQIDSTNYLCAYDGGGTGTGWASILTVDTGTWEITEAASYEYDITLGETPALAQIDSSNYLCAYEGEGSDGYAVVLKPDLGGEGGGEIRP